ncbi:ABC transporter permease [Agrobacterium genomosp. 3]|uniref:ABC transporter permease n=1 Tax=Agrobacterium tomkonis TaxID=1183410 RepID=UPI001CD8860C|nr:ABC transporter permease [Agrobacterium tomkonis]MCA1879257.1 ABC transporter permease [Agrobacterium tumefaciens]MCA1894420.1 ABC transporter permease [Agrobacterium tomkonis]
MSANTNTVSAGGSRQVWKSFGPILSQPRSAVGLVIVILAIIAAIGAPIIAPYDPNQPDFLSILAPPSSAHWLGTDDLGRDVLSRIIYGSQASLMVGALSVVGALVVGTLVGLLSGYFGGGVDAILMRIMDIIFAFPAILLALAITAVLGPSLPNAILAIAIVNLPVFARIARAQTLVLRRQEFVEAKRSLGFGTFNILMTTILPNSLAPLVVQGSLLFASAIITESYLSFLGLGVQPPAATWGNMLKSALGFMDIAPWLAWFPGVAIFITVLGFNLLGDGLRDQFDPRG